MRNVKKLFMILFLAVVSTISLIPFYLMFSMSTYKSEKIFQNNPLIPSDFFGENLKTIFQSNFVQSYLNSFVISVSAMILSVLVCSMAGYAMNVYRFRLRKVVYMFIMMTMMVPTQIGIIGYMIEMRNMHLNQSLIPMICPWIASGIGAYWMISFFKSGLPLELVERARIDGANELVIYFRIALPCIKPGILTLALLQFLWSWNSYIYPLVFVNKQDNYTIPIFVKSLASAYRTDYGAQLAGLTLSTIPVLILFLFGSKSFIKGMTAGAVKG